MARLMDVTEGEILIDGRNIEDYDLETLRNAFGFVPQTNILFSGTIGSNLRLGNKDASEELLDQVTKAALFMITLWKMSLVMMQRFNRVEQTSLAVKDSDSVLRGLWQLNLNVGIR